MKKIFLLAATVFTLSAFQSCSKCGHCVTTTTYTVFGGGTTTNTEKGATYCGDNGNESGSYRKQAQLNCERWEKEQTPVTGTTFSSSWVADK
jgi:hypothetical protein